MSGWNAPDATLPADQCRRLGPAGERQAHHGPAERRQAIGQRCHGRRRTPADERTDRPVAQCGRGGPLELDFAGQFRKPAGRLELGDLGRLGEDAGLGW